MAALDRLLAFIRRKKVLPNFRQNDKWSLVALCLDRLEALNGIVCRTVDQ